MSRCHKRCMLLIIFVLFLVVPSAWAGIRCGNDIISTGDTRVQVRAKISACGEILETDTFVRETTRKRKKEKFTIQIKVDQWFIKVRERGSFYCYPLTFEDGKLTDIGRWTRCN